MPDNIYIVLILLILHACMHAYIYTYTHAYIYTFPSKGIGGFVHVCIDIQRLTAHMFKSQVNLLRLPDHFV